MTVDAQSAFAAFDDDPIPVEPITQSFNINADSEEIAEPEKHVEHHDNKEQEIAAVSQPLNSPGYS